jgi:hypothetical protein
MTHTSRNSFPKVGAGDVLWIVTSGGPDDLALVGRLRVDRILARAQAERALRRKNLWRADWYAICNAPKEQQIRMNISQYARKLSFDGGVTRLPTGFTGMNLQALRRLDDDGRELMEHLWARSKKTEK